MPRHQSECRARCAPQTQGPTPVTGAPPQAEFTRGVGGSFAHSASTESTCPLRLMIPCACSLRSTQRAALIALATAAHFARAAEPANPVASPHDDVAALEKFEIVG